MKYKAQQKLLGRSNTTCCLQSLLARNHTNICKSMGGSNNRGGLLPSVAASLHSAMCLLKVGERNEEQTGRRGQLAENGWNIQRMTMVQRDKQMHTSHTDTQMETAEQKQTHGSGRILKPGPYSIKASLGPSSLEDPPPRLPPSSAASTHVLWISSLSPSSSLCFLVICRAASSLSCLPLLTLSSPALPASLHHPPSSPLASL